MWPPGLFIKVYIVLRPVGMAYRYIVILISRGRATEAVAVKIISALAQIYRNV